MKLLNPKQAYVLELQITRMKLEDGQVMDIARAVAQDATLVSLAHLTEAQAESLIEEFDMIQRRLQKPVHA